MNNQEAVPFEIVPIHEVSGTNPDAVKVAFERIASGELPGFVIRAAGVELGNEPVSTMQGIARAAAGKATGTEHRVGATFNIAKSPTHAKESGLHADSNISDEKPESYHMHTTSSEEPSEVMLANPGPSLADSGINARHAERLHDLFAIGQTDPSLVEPTFHSGMLSNHDTAVFRVSGKRPTWHDISTPKGSRESHVAVLAPEIEVPTVNETISDPIP